MHVLPSNTVWRHISREGCRQVCWRLWEKLCWLRRYVPRVATCTRSHRLLEFLPQLPLVVTLLHNCATVRWSDSWSISSTENKTKSNQWHRLLYASQILFISWNVWLGTPSLTRAIPLCEWVQTQIANTPLNDTLVKYKPYNREESRNVFSGSIWINRCKYCQ